MASSEINTIFSKIVLVNSKESPSIKARISSKKLMILIPTSSVNKEIGFTHS